MQIKGTLIPIGGNEDKGEEIKSEADTLEYIHDGILSKIVQESGGKNALIAVLPTASRIPERVSTLYLEAFKKLGCTNIKIVNVRSSKDAAKEEHIEILKRADCVMFSGGDQSRIIKSIGGTEMERIIKRRFVSEDFIVAGTSAGAMSMSREMITGGGKRDGFYKGGVQMGKGLGLNPNLIIDSHFIRRHRFGRLSEAIARFPSLIGIGLGEDTGLIIKNMTECEVIGSGMVIIIDPRKLTHNNQAILKEGQPMSLANMKVHLLTKGDTMKIDEAELLISLSNSLVDGKVKKVKI